MADVDLRFKLATGTGPVHREASHEKLTAQRVFRHPPWGSLLVEFLTIIISSQAAVFTGLPITLLIACASMSRPWLS